jgi:hypothetical protein
VNYKQTPEACLKTTAREAGDSTHAISAVARFTGSLLIVSTDPGAYAPGFMLSPAPRALVNDCVVYRVSAYQPASHPRVYSSLERRHCHCPAFPNFLPVS